MQRWLYFVKLDETYDLTRLGRAGGGWRRRLWLSVLHAYAVIDGQLEDGRLGGGPVGRAIRDGLQIEPTQEETEAWLDAVCALRDTARRVMGHRPPRRLAKARRAAIDPLEADVIVERYVARTRPTLRFSAKPLRTFERMTLEPVVPEKVMCFGDGSRVFWQFVFASMMPGFGVPVCRDCGVELADSKTGKRSKAERCRPCRNAAYRAQFTDEEWRKRETERKREQRKELKKERLREQARRANDRGK